MHSIDKNAMALFVKVVENQSFSRTAQRENVPVSTVSRKISELEKALGVRLLERSTRRLRLTEMGQDYYAHCRRGVEEFESANLLIQSRQKEVAGTLRLSVPPSLSAMLVAPLVRDFQHHYPNVEVHVLVTDRYVHLIEDGIDFALRVGELADSNLVARPLLRYRHRLVASPAYLAQSGQPGQPADLHDHALIAFSSWFSEPAWTLHNGTDVATLHLRPRLAINDFNGIRQAVLSDQGIGELPAMLCEQELATGQLVNVMPHWQFEEVTLSAVYASRINLSRVVRLFKEYCLQHIGEFVAATTP